MGHHLYDENRYEFKCGVCGSTAYGHKGRCVCGICKARAVDLRIIYEKECSRLSLLASDARTVAYRPIAAALQAAFELGRKDCETEMEAAGFRHP